MKVYLLAFAFLASVRLANSLSPGLTDDRQALLDLKAAVIDSAGSLLDGWTPQGRPCNPAWKYVYCEERRVTRLKLSNLELAGTLPASLALASRLGIINLSGNRFTGNIPQTWAETFGNLTTLKLSNNQLDGTLPIWTTPGLWPKLKTLDLSGNLFYGGLPNSWLGRAKPLRALTRLNLAFNQLGWTADASGAKGGQSARLADWCSAVKRAPREGWCPSETPPGGTMLKLQVLDLSDNSFVGGLPPKWPKMFPALRSLRVFGNDITHVDRDREGIAPPSPLPDTWAKRGLGGFPALESMVLFPGNQYLCSIPDGEYGYRDVGLDSRFVILNEAGNTFDSDNPAQCPVDIKIDNPPTIAAINTTALAFTYAPLGYTRLGKYPIYGFRVTVAKKDYTWEEEVYLPLAKFNNRVYRVYTNAANADLVAADLSYSGSYNLALPEAALQVGDWVKVQISTINMDSSESMAQAEVQLSA